MAMTFLSNRCKPSYAANMSPRPKLGNGPWREAIDYWLKKRNMRAADLVRKAAEGSDTITKNTVSKATRGFDVNTSTLRRLAELFDTTLDMVLVSPEKLYTAENRMKTVVETLQAVSGKADLDPAKILMGLEQSGIDLLEREVEEEERLQETEQATQKKKVYRKPTRSVKKNYKKS